MAPSPPAADARREILADGFGGILVDPFDPSYDERRRCHNGLVDRRPALLAYCRGTADVADAVRFANAEDLEIAVRGGGHNVAGHAVCDDGLVIDLSLMRGVDVDPRAHTARVQGGALWSDVNREAAVHGLAVTGGAISSTGVGGYTLGGGLGWLMGICGLAVDNLLEAEVVLASGDVVRAGPDEHKDLFWALRGGGGNFGVVTSFVFRLHPVAGVVGGLIAHPVQAAGDLLRLFRDVTANVPDELTIFAGLAHAPDGSGLPIAALLVCHAGDRERAEADLRPLLEWGDPVMAEVGPMPYPVMNTLLDDGFPRGALNYWKSTFVDAVDDALIDVVTQRFDHCPTPMGAILLEHYHGAVTRVPRDATAVPHRAAGYNLLIPTVWDDPDATGASIAWTRETYEALAPFHTGRRWLNYYGDDEDSAALEAAYGPNRGRLAEVKRRYDPDNVFHHNQNLVPPAPAPRAPSFEDYGSNPALNYERFFVPAIAAPLARELVDIAAPEPGERVLDAACGTGVVARLAVERIGAGGRVTGLDPNPGMLAAAQKAAAEAGLTIEWRQAGAEATGLPDGSYDAALCQMGLQFFPDRPAALRELWRVLVPDGRLVANVPGPVPRMFTVLQEVLRNRLSREAAGFVAAVFSLYEPSELEELASRAGFRDVTVERRRRTLRLPEPATFLWQYVSSTPLAAAAARLDETQRAALERDVVSGWESFVRDGGLMLDAEISILTARRT